MNGYDLPSLVRPMGDWVERAACKDAPQHVFYPPKGCIPHEAKAICARCPVVVECLDWAISLPEKYGVWGGTTERERRTGTRVRLCAWCNETFHFEAKPGMNIPKTCSDACRLKRHSMMKVAANRRRLAG